jgi:hypothetical protein
VTEREHLQDNDKRQVLPALLVKAQLLKVWSEDQHQSTTCLLSIHDDMGLKIKQKHFVTFIPIEQSSFMFIGSNNFLNFSTSTSKNSWSSLLMFILSLQQN